MRRYSGEFIKFDVEDKVGDIISYEVFIKSNYKKLIDLPILNNFYETIGVIKNILVSKKNAVVIFESKYHNLDRFKKISFSFESLEFKNDEIIYDNLKKHNVRIIEKLQIKMISIVDLSTYNVDDIVRLG